MDAALCSNWDQNLCGNRSDGGCLCVWEDAQCSKSSECNGFGITSVDTGGGAVIDLSGDDDATTSVDASVSSSRSTTIEANLDAENVVTIPGATQVTIKFALGGLRYSKISDSAELLQSSVAAIREAIALEAKKYVTMTNDAVNVKLSAGVSDDVEVMAIVTPQVAHVAVLWSSLAGVGSNALRNTVEVNLSNVTGLAAVRDGHVVINGGIRTLAEEGSPGKTSTEEGSSLRLDVGNADARVCSSALALVVFGASACL